MSFPLEYRAWIHDNWFRSEEPPVFKMCKVHSIHFGTGNIIVSSGSGNVSVPNIAYKLMTFIGQYDKNGTKIFTRDIITGGHYNGSYARGEIVYQNAQFVAKPIGRFMEGYYELYTQNQNLIEVVGNVYQNPELMKIE